MISSKKTRLFPILSLFLVGVICMASAPRAGAEEKPLPDRMVSMAVEYPSVEIPPDENVSMNVIFYNKGRSDENVDVWISRLPDRWTARLKTYRFAVSAIHVPSDDSKTLTFEATPDEHIPEGDYTFRIEAKTPDGRFHMAQDVTITIKKKKEGVKETKGVKLTTSYPVLKGPSDGEFEFSVEVDSKLEEDSIFDLFAEGPDGWTVNFKPAYESKFISSLRIKANQSQTVAVQVKPPASAQEGEYPVKIRVSANDAKAEAKLMVVLTGTYDIEVGTASGLLSLDAKQGKTSSVSFYVKNTGSAVNNQISFMSFKPENWKVEFDPESIDAIEPGDLKQVDVKITPYEDALVGDYSVSLKINGEKVSKNMEFRVSVKASSRWAWIGIAIIVCVIALLTVIFRKLGRR
ncbi:MAG: NEW3 domain-containing protein [Deltaproteobacteria bacterium]|nr:NEW3 domain-containing protein [Deltaproteobacteria bacterium]